MINPKKTYTLDEYIEILRKRIWYIVIPFFVISAAAVAYAMYAPRLYKASTLVLVSPQSIPEDYVRATVTAGVEERLQSIAQEVLSRTRLEKIINELNLYPEERKKITLQEAVTLMQEDIKIELPTKKEESKGYFTITYIGKDPEIVTRVANNLSSQFIEENLKLRERQAESTTEFLSVELASAKKKLDEMETAIAGYKSRYMGELPEQRDSNIKILEQLQNQYQRTGENLRAAKDRRLFLQKQISDMQAGVSGTPGNEMGTPSSVLGGGASNMPFMKKGYQESEKEFLVRSLESLRTMYKESHPDVIAAEKRLADFEKNEAQKEVTDDFGIKKDPVYRELNSQVELTDIEIARLSREESAIAVQIEKYRGRIEKAPVREQEMASLLREYQSTKDSHERLLKKSQDAQQAENLEKRQKGERFKIIDTARVPEKPFSPDIPKILLIGIFSAIGGGLGLAFFREQLDRSFNDSPDVEITLGLKVLATIPRIENKAA